MAAFRLTTASNRVKRLPHTRKLVNSLQCAGVTRRGGRCSRRVTASNLPGQSGNTNPANYCKIHLRSSAVSPNPRRTAKGGPFTGP